MKVEDPKTKNKQVKLLLYLAKICYEHKLMSLSLKFAEYALTLDSRNAATLLRLARIHHRLGNVTQRLQYLKQHHARTHCMIDNELACARDEKRLLLAEWQWRGKAHTATNRGRIIVHVWNKSLPEINGYTIRNAAIAAYQMEMGLHPVAVTKLGWPEDDHLRGSIRTAFHSIDHYRLYDTNQHRLNRVPMSAYFQAYADKFAELIRLLNPRVVHAASNFQNALPPLSVAKRMGIPTVYEVRGMWHFSQAAKIKGFEHSERFCLHEKYELICCHLADKVIVICETLKKYLISLGIPSKKIHVIHNGVNAVQFQPQPPCPKLMQKYGLTGKRVIGFVGSIEKYEGLDYLLRALAHLRKRCNNLRLLIVGEGSALPRLQQLSLTLGMKDIVFFVRRVPHEDVSRYYSVIDLFAFPRTRDSVCQLVTPLKPYEAMAMGKTVLVSDVPALREIVTDGKTGLMFQSEDVKSLIACLKRSEEYPNLGKQARDWVIQHRDWRQLVQQFNTIYGH